MTVMLESKIEATHRLQRSGQWNAASLYRDRERLRPRAILGRRLGKVPGSRCLNGFVRLMKMRFRRQTP